MSRSNIAAVCLCLIVNITTTLLQEQMDNISNYQATRYKTYFYKFW